jgi:acyl-CoA synthetase (NDP forming)
VSWIISLIELTTHQHTNAQQLSQSVKNLPSMPYTDLMKDLKSLFYPKSVAVVGVSEDPAKLGSVVLNNMLEAGFEGRLFPVNPKYTSLFGIKTFAKVSDIEEAIDLVVIVVPAQFVLEIIKDCAVKKVESVIIISAGFKEISSEGALLENQIIEVAKEANINILGPNCSRSQELFVLRS